MSDTPTIPMTRLPGQYQEEIRIVKKYVPAKPPAVKPWVPRCCPRATIDEERLLIWVASVKDILELVPYLNCINVKLLAFGVRPPRSAPDRIGCCCESVNFNGDDLSQWIAKADKDEVPRLRNISAAMRLRILGTTRAGRTTRRRRIAKRRGR